MRQLRNFITLTHSEGFPVHISPRHITGLQQPGLAHGDTCTLVYTSDSPETEISVIETPEQIDAAMNGYYAPGPEHHVAETA